jgi:hypothetical protein
MAFQWTDACAHVLRNHESRRFLVAFDLLRFPTTLPFDIDGKQEGGSAGTSGETYPRRWVSLHSSCSITNC